MTSPPPASTPARDRRLPAIAAAFVEYAGALALAAAGLLAEAFVLDRLGGAVTFEPSLLAVALSAWLFRLMPTLLALAASAAGQLYYFLEPRGSFALAAPGDATSFGLFVFAALVIALVIDRLKRSHAAQASARRELVEVDRARLASEARLGEGLNGIGDPVLMLRPVRGTGQAIHDFTVEYANEAAARLHAAGDPAHAGPPSRDAQVGRRLGEAAPWHASLGLVAAYARVSETGRPLSTEVDLRPAQLAQPNRGFAAPAPWQGEAEVRASRLGGDDGMVVVHLRDVGEHRRAARGVAESERQLRRVLDALNAFVAVMTPDGTVVGVNDATLRAAGIGQGDVVGRKFWDCYWWSYAEASHRQMRDWVGRAWGGEAVRADVAARAAGGAMTTLDFMLSPLRDESGAVTLLIGSGVDVSARDRALAELAGRERHYRQLIEGLPMLSWTCDADGRCDFLSRRWADYTGVDVGRQLGFGWLEAVHPDDRVRVESGWRQAALTGSRYATEFRLRGQDGLYRWFDTRGEPIRDADGGVVRWFGTNLDIEDRRRAEQRFRRLYESNLVGIVYYHYDGTLTDPNSAFHALLGYDPSNVPDKLDWRALTPPEWASVDEAQWGRLNTVGRCGPFEKEFFRADGTRVPVLIAGADLDPGNPEFGVAYVVDLTQAKRAEEALRRTEADLRMVNESLEHRIQERTLELQHRSDQLRALALDLTETESRERKRLAQVLHDHFQQLVSAAKLKVGMVRRKLTDPALIETVRQVEGLLEETINASRSLATELSPPVLHDAGLGPALEWLARRMEKAHNLLVTVSVDPNCEPDNEQVRTILFECARELLFNVVKHAQSERAELVVSMPQEGLLQLAVIDHGKGFDANAIEMKAKPDGSFGLFSIKERLGLLGGLVRIRSHAGHGTSVQMTVPVTVKNPNRDGILGDLPEQPSADASDPRRVPHMRVLVADDHRLFREGLISLIVQEPYVEVVGQANDGEQAVAMARDLRPDILICDVTMPKLNGVQVTAQLSREMPDVKVIGLSMHEREDMATAMRGAGALAYLSKGGPTETLLNVLRGVATTAKAER